MVVVRLSLMALIPFHFQRGQARRPNRLNPSSNKQTVKHHQTENPYGGAFLKTMVVVCSSLMAWLAFHFQRGQARQPNRPNPSSNKQTALYNTPRRKIPMEALF